MNQWKLYQKETIKKITGLQLLVNAKTVAAVNKDFGGLHKGQAFAVFKPSTLEQAQLFLSYCHTEKLPIVIRCNGLSQSGQSLCHKNQVVLDVSTLNTSVAMRENTVLAGCSASWAMVLRQTLKHNKIPPVFPYNTRLSIGGVLSVGGLGSSSAQYGTCNAHVRALQVLCMDGSVVDCNKYQNYSLMQAVLSGIGQFGLIYSIELELHQSPELVYLQEYYFENANTWLNEQFLWRDRKTMFLEANCWFADPVTATVYEQPQYRITLCSDNQALLKKNTESDSQSGIMSMSMQEYVFRHEPRIDKMMSTPYLDYLHPWFECYMTREVFHKSMKFLINTYPRSLGPVVHCFPVARKHSSLFQMPQGSDIMTFNMLTPGIKNNELEQCRHWIREVDSLLRQQGGKRYISSWIEKSYDAAFWEGHYGDDWTKWQQLKNDYDPHCLLGANIAPSFSKGSGTL